jgi:hypothetical protein
MREDAIETDEFADVQGGSPVIGYWKLDAGSWILDAGYWKLDTGCWILEAGYWKLDTGSWMLEAGYCL